MCKAVSGCHPILAPETINFAGERVSIKDKHRHVAGTACRHYTCWSGGGEHAARAAMTGSSEEFVVTEYDGTTRTIRGWAFGTWEKPTHKEKLRIVSEEGNIYSYQDEGYFATGQSV